MKFITALALLFGVAGLAHAAAVEAPAHHLADRACMPQSCYDQGCCSGNCKYWCRACDIKYTC